MLFTSTVFPQKCAQWKAASCFPRRRAGSPLPGPPPNPRLCPGAPCGSALGGSVLLQTWLCHRAPPGLWQLQTAPAGPCPLVGLTGTAGLLSRPPAFPWVSTSDRDALWASSLALVHPHLLTFRAAGRPCRLVLLWTSLWVGEALSFLPVKWREHTQKRLCNAPQQLHSTSSPLNGES